MFYVGMKVRLSTPDNERINNTIVEVEEFTAWGAHVLAPACATGKYRAAWCEMLPISDIDIHIYNSKSATDNGKHQLPTDHQNGGLSKSNGEALRQSGYTGDMCDMCQSMRVVRNGNCLKCEDCGSTSGCG